MAGGDLAKVEHTRGRQIAAHHDAVVAQAVALQITEAVHCGRAVCWQALHEDGARLVRSGKRLVVHGHGATAVWCQAAAGAGCERELPWRFNGDRQRLAGKIVDAQDPLSAQGPRGHGSKGDRVGLARNDLDAGIFLRVQAAERKGVVCRLRRAAGRSCDRQR